MARLSHEDADRQVELAMKEPASTRVQRFRELITQRGGRAEQPFGAEEAPRQLREPDRPLPARTTV